jgi:SpoVK/Ycf46/Vps4 family AAA+-type ATPase
VLTVKLPNVGFDRKFLSNILEPFFKEVCQLASIKNKESISNFLIRMGLQVREVPEGTPTDLNSLYESNGFVGYEDVKEHLENGVINAWSNKEKFEQIAKAKYKNIKDIIPNAVLFEGPAGTGKTTLANIIGSHLQYPFVYIPLNSFMSKWYGEAEQRLAMIFEKIGELAELKGGAVIMIDEIDEIGSNRENSSEASGKVTGVLLKKLDGMERIKNILLIGATNCKNMLDPALISRLKYSQFFRLPNEAEILKIVTYYLPELVDIPHDFFTPYIGKISGRHIKNVCEDVTRIAIDNEIKGIETDLLAIFLKSMTRSISQ